MEDDGGKGDIFVKRDSWRGVREMPKNKHASRTPNHDPRTMRRGEGTSSTTTGKY